MDSGRATLKVFISYSHEDRDLLERLQKHLSTLCRQGLISLWANHYISAGQEWEGKIHKNLESADIILLLVSPGFGNSAYCNDVEVKHAMAMHQDRKARVIPVILRDFDWHGLPFGKLQALPTDGKPVASSINRDEALKDVAIGIRKAVEEILAERLQGDTKSSPAKEEDDLLEDMRRLEPGAYDQQLKQKKQLNSAREIVQKLKLPTTEFIKLYRATRAFHQNLRSLEVADQIVNRILDELGKFLRPGDHVCGPLLEFLVRAHSHRDIAEHPEKGELEAWIQNNTRAPDLMDVQHRLMRESTTHYLAVEICVGGDRQFVKAYLCDSKGEYFKALLPRKCTTISEASAASAFRELFVEFESILQNEQRDAADRVMIEFFLSREQFLWNIDSWGPFSPIEKMDPESLGILYPTVIRWRERHSNISPKANLSLENKWRRVYNTIAEHPNPRPPCWLKPNECSPVELSRQLESGELGDCLGFMFVPPKANFEACTLSHALKAGAPFAVWLREDLCHPQDCTLLQEVFEQLVQFDVELLPHKLCEMRRKQGFGHGRLESALALLWDHPKHSVPRILLHVPT